MKENQIPEPYVNSPSHVTGGRLFILDLQTRHVWP